MTVRSIQGESLDARLARWQSAGGMACLVGAVLSVIGWSVSPLTFYAAWLTAFFYWLGITLGCLGWTAIHGMAGGEWGLLVRRILRDSALAIPLMIILFVPIWLNAGQIYEWANLEFLRQHPELSRKTGYLNVTGFQILATVYLTVWVLMAWFLCRMPLQMDSEDDAVIASQWQRYSGIAFIVYGFSMSLAAVDWMMSLEPEWYSTMYALIHIAGQGVSGMAFAIVVLGHLRNVQPWSNAITSERMNDVGNLLLAAVMFWAYCTFFQYLVIWCGNLPEENVWYLHRNHHGWPYLIFTLLALDFILPFLLLLARQRKRNLVDLSRIAWCLLVMRYFELYWLAVPGFAHRRSVLAFHWIDAAAFAAIGGAWIVSFCWRLKADLRFSVTHHG